MPKRKLHYKEGDWFAVPLEGGGYALGLIARMKHKGILGYFFGPRYSELPTLSDAAAQEPSRAMERLIFGDLSLLNQEWPVIGALPRWDRSNWPMPSFIHRDRVSGVCYVRTYDEDTLHFLSERRATLEEVASLPKDGDYGAGAVVISLSRLVRKAEVAGADAQN